MRLLGLVLLTLGVASVLWSVFGAWQAARLSHHRRQVEDTPAPSLASAYAEKWAARRALQHQWELEYAELVARTLAVECTCPGVHPHSYGACAIHTVHPLTDEERVRVYRQILELIDRIRPKENQ